MLYLILFAVAAMLVVLAWRHWRLHRGIALLADAVEQRRPFLSADSALTRLHGSWSRLTRETDSVVRELDRLSHQRAGQLAQVEATLGSLCEAVLILDRSNYVLLANASVRRMFPSAQNVLGQRIETVARSASFLEFIEFVRSGAAGAEREIEFVAPSGSVWVDATGVTVPADDAASAPWTLFVLHDITRQKKLELVRKEFVANVSHELKTPLSVIKGYAETLVGDHRQMPADERDQFIRTIYRHSERLTAILEDLLTLSRLESGNPGFQPSVQPINEFLANLTEEFSPRFAESGHTLVLAVSTSAETRVFIDALRMTQVIANLFDNARKYTPRGSTIELGASLGSAASEVELWVRDDGPGIPAADLPRIFERFYRIEKGRGREKGGSGLGLSIVKHIVQLHGGRVWAESEAGKGTRIAFTLPVRAANPGATSPATAAPVEPAVADARASAERT